MEKLRLSAQQQHNQRYVVETITMTTVTERRIVREAAAATTAPSVSTGTGTENAKLDAIVGNDTSSGMASSTSDHQLSAVHQPNITSTDGQSQQNERGPYLNAIDGKLSSQIAGILKGGKMWKNEQTQVSWYYTDPY